MDLPNRQAYSVFAVVALALLMSSIDSTIVAVGLPTMLRDLKTNLAWMGWTLTGYQLTQTIVMPIAGKLSDDWGRKRLFLSAVLLFTLSSMAAGLAPNIYVLIIFRLLQGIGGGTFLPSATGIVSDAFGRRRASAIGLFTSIFPLGGVLGPNIGGIIIDNLKWRWIFYVNVPIGILLVLFGMAILPVDKIAAIHRKVDLVGVGLFAAAMLAIMYAMTVWGNQPEAAGHPMIWIFFALGIMLLGFFLRQESRSAEPMMDLMLLRWRPFLAANAYNFIYGAAVFGFFSFIPYYATVAYGMTAGESGIILTPRSLASVVMSAVSSFSLIRFGYRVPMIIGSIFVSLSLLLLSGGYHDVSLLGLHIPNIGLMALEVLLAGVGMGISSPAANNAALDLVPGKVAAVAGIRGMFRSIGGVMGTATIVLALSHFHDKAVGLQHVFFVLAFLVLAVIPLVFSIPDIARERRMARESVQSEEKEVASVGLD